MWYICVNGGEFMGMTDRQFDSYRTLLLKQLKEILAVTPENHKLEEFIRDLEAELKRP